MHGKDIQLHDVIQLIPENENKRQNFTRFIETDNIDYNLSLFKLLPFLLKRTICHFLEYAMALLLHIYSFFKILVQILIT